MMKRISILMLGLFLSFISIQAQTTWMQIGNDINGEFPGEDFGSSISLSADGSVVAIGAFNNDENGQSSGRVRVYKKQGETWEQIGDDIDGETPYNKLGHSVSLSADGSVIAIGAPGNWGIGQASGHVCIYKNQNGSWTQIGNDIDGEAADDSSGTSVNLSADGSVVAIGAPYNDGNGEDSGHVRVYKNQGGVWEQIGEDIDGDNEYDNLGEFISLSANGAVVVIGMPYNGHVRVYKNQDGVWVKMGSDIYSEVENDGLGSSVSLNADGSVVAIGAPDKGYVGIYEYQRGTWTQIGNNINGEVDGDMSGQSVSLSADGSIVAIGAPDYAESNDWSGHVRVYKNQGGSWIQIGSSINGETTNNSSGLGDVVSLSADGLIVAVSGYNSNDYQYGQVRVFKQSFDGIEELQNFDITVYPNPTKDMISLTFSDYQIKQLSITDIMGKEVFVKTNVQEKEKVDLSGFSNGIYIIKATTVNNEVLTTRIVKE